LNERLTWFDRLLGVRDRLLASPRFQRWAVAFPPTRLIARRRARALFDLCAGVVYSQVLLACVRLQLFEILAEGPQTAAQLAARSALSEPAMARLLKAAVALQLIEPRSQQRFGLGVLGAAMLGNPGVAAMVEHHALLYGDLHDPVTLLRGESATTGLARYWAYAGNRQADALTEAQVATYSALMSASQSFIASEVLTAYPLGKHRCLLDVGGGDGTFLCQVARHAPALQLILFDLPAVAALARARFAREGLAARATAVGGDAVAGPLPTGADIISLVRVIHDHDDAVALAILRAVRQALPADGTLLLAEPMSGSHGVEPMSDAYFGFYLLAMGSGQPRTTTELNALLNAAGFGRTQLLPARNP
jgi:demethylspheroidene O-methyltransferase